MKINPIIFQNKNRLKDGQKKAIKLRREVNRLYFEEGLSKICIARKKRLSNNFVLRWTLSRNQDFSADNRGWPMGKRRKWDDRTIETIKEIHQSLIGDPKEFFAGATAIVNEWRKKYPEVEIPPLRTIGRILSDLHLSGNRKTGRNKGAARYLHYPEYTIQNLLGGMVLEADFIQKHLRNRTKPLHFVGYSFKKAPKLRHYKRIESQTGRELKKACDAFFKEYEKPDFIKVDNAAAMIGSASIENKRNLSSFMLHMLKNEVIPIFSVPRKPFSQASIEGNNSVFSRKFWNRIEFESIDEVDEKLEWFNDSSQRYSGYSKPEKKKLRKGKFIPKVYFIRQVQENEESENGYIDILHEQIEIPEQFINYFVLGEWNLKEEKLHVRYENEERSNIIATKEFHINERSKQKYIK